MALCPGGERSEHEGTGGNQLRRSTLPFRQRIRAQRRVTACVAHKIEKLLASRRGAPPFERVEDPTAGFFIEEASSGGRRTYFYACPRKGANAPRAGLFDSKSRLSHLQLFSIPDKINCTCLNMKGEPALWHRILLLSLPWRMAAR